MSDLTGQTVANTYKDLIQAPNANTGISDQQITTLADGTGNALPLGIKRAQTGQTDSAVYIGNDDIGTENIGTNLISLSSTANVDIAGTDQVNITTDPETGRIETRCNYMLLNGIQRNAVIGGVAMIGLSGEGNEWVTQTELDQIEELPQGAHESTRRVILASSLIPNYNNTYDIGSAEKKIRHLYLSPNSLYFENDNTDTSNVSLASVSMYSIGLSALANTRAITISPVTDGVKGESQFVASESYAFHEQPLQTEPAQFGTESLVHIAPGVQDGNLYNIHAPDFAGQTKTVVLSAVDDTFRPKIGCASAIVSHEDGTIKSNIQFAVETAQTTDAIWVLECRAIQVADSLCWLMTLPNEPEHSIVAYS